MSDFLTDLERQLLAAHPRRRAARRRATAGRVLREAPVVLLVLAVLGGAVAFVAQVGSGDPGTAPATAPASPITSEPTFAATDPPLAAESLVVLNASGRPGRGQAVADVVALRRPVATVGTAPALLRRSVVAYTRGQGRAARRVANGLGLDLRLLRDGEPVAARRAGIVVLVGEDVLGAEVRTLRTPGGTVTGKVGQVQRAGEGRLVSVATRQAAQTTVELRPCPRGQSCTIGVFGPGAGAGFVSFGVRFTGHTVVLRRGGRTVSSARFSPTVPQAVRAQAVSVLDTAAKEPRGGRALAAILQRETTTARSASTPPAIRGVDVQYAPGAGAVAARIARRFGVRARPFTTKLIRAQAGAEAGVAVRLGLSFRGARLVRLGRSTVSVVRYGRGQARPGTFEEFCDLNPGACDDPDREDRRVVTAEVDAPRGSVVRFAFEGRIVREVTNTGGGVDVAFSLATASNGPVTVTVDGRRIGVVPLG